MALDTTALRNAVARLGEGLVAAGARPDDELLRDGVIQRFEYTYELSGNVLRRYLEESEPQGESVGAMSFPALIRLASERGLLINGWDVWSSYRKARGTTSHSYASDDAAEVFDQIPAFFDDARALLAEIERRLSAP